MKRFAQFLAAFAATHALCIWFMGNLEGWRWVHEHAGMLMWLIVTSAGIGWWSALPNRPPEALTSPSPTSEEP